MNFQTSYSRRQFLSTAAMTTGAAVVLHPSLGWAADETDPRVAGIVASTFGIDAHNHVDVPLAAAEMPNPDDIDLAGEMKRSGLAAICMAFATDYQQGDAYDRFHKGLESMDRVLERDHMKRSLKPGDIRTAHKNHQPTVIQSLEGGHFLQGHVERLAEAHKRGLRLLGLLHDSDAPVPLGDVYTKPPVFGGLTEFGVDVVKECNRLGILIDLTHASLQTTEAALKVSTRPLVFSHTGLDTQLGNDPRMAETMRKRLISKEHAKIIADAGGLVGVWTHLSDTPLEYAQNIRAMADVIGVDHVCIGTDTKLTQPAPRPGGGFRSGQRDAQIGERTNIAWAGQTAGFYFVVVDAMLKAGFTPDEIGKIGGENFLRVFGKAVAA